MNIILAGMPGSGKSVVSVLLAAKLGFKAVDTDAVIEESHGKISKIFADYGEKYFRKLESEVIEKLASIDNTVIATGGGSLVNPKNCTALRASGKIIYLMAEVDELTKRLKGDLSRPLLFGDMQANLKNLYGRRAKIFEAAADYTVQTDGLTPDEIAEKIVEILK